MRVVISWCQCEQAKAHRVGIGITRLLFRRSPARYVFMHQWDSVVYGLDYPGFESQQKAPKGPNRLWGPLSLLYRGYRGSYLGVKRPRREVGHSFSSSVEV